MIWFAVVVEKAALVTAPELSNALLVVVVASRAALVATPVARPRDIEN
jgi:hypothetical protein